MRGELTFMVPTLLGFLLTLARVGGVVAFVPIPGIRSAPDIARVVLTLGITLCLSAKWSAPATAAATPGTVVLWALGEAAIGVTIGVCLAFLIEAFQLGAQIFGLQAGYSYASTIDPNSQADSSVMQVFAQLTAVALFFTLGFDRDLIRALWRSFDQCPPGTYVAQPQSVDSIVRLGGGMFVTGLRLAFPVVALLLMVDIALALLGRMQSQLQLVTVAFPAKMLAALGVLATLAAILPRIFESAAKDCFRAVERALGG